MAEQKNTGNVTALVVVDLYAWHDKSGDPSTPLNEARKGDEISVSKDEFDRGSSMTPPGLAKKDSKEARAFLAGPPSSEAAKLAGLNDDELRAVLALRGAEGVDEMSRDELLGTILQ